MEQCCRWQIGVIFKLVNVQRLMFQCSSHARGLLDQNAHRDWICRFLRANNIKSERNLSRTSWTRLIITIIVWHIAQGMCCYTTFSFWKLACKPFSCTRHNYEHPVAPKTRYWPVILVLEVDKRCRWILFSKLLVVSHSSFASYLPVRYVELGYNFGILFPFRRIFQTSLHWPVHPIDIFSH
jgi:hypothetical protein